MTTNRSIRKQVFQTLASATVVLLLGGCQPPTSAPGNTNTTPVVPTGPRTNRVISLRDVTVHYVKLTHPYKLTTGDQSRTIETARLVKFALDNMQPAPALAPEFHIGEHRIPEYGGWKGGIYFKLYDDAQIKLLDGQEIFVTEPGGARRSLSRRFSVPLLTNTVPMEERRVLLE